jgi:hypothetical protein
VLVAENTGVPVRVIRMATGYWAAYPEEIDAEIAAADTAEESAEQDEEILIGATEAGRALVTANIKDFMPIDARYRAANRAHAGLVMVSTKTFPQNRGYVTAGASALDALLGTDGGIPAGGIVFLQRP